MMGKIFERILKNKGLPLVLIVFTIFTVSLTENLQIADGFSVSAKQILFELNPGETAEWKWTVTNPDDENIFVELYATGPGSELMIFDKYLTVPPHLSVHPEIFVVVPEDHPNNIEYHPELYALKRAAPPVQNGDVLEASISINVQMKSLPIIKIGPNPVYTEPEVEAKAEIPPPPKVKEIPKEEPVREETAAEKIARIQAGNEEFEQEKPKTTQAPKVEEKPTVTPTPFGYEPEPEMDNEPIIYDKDNLPETEGTCGIWELILSLFGLAKC